MSTHEEKKLEYCFKCGEPTGHAGKGEDSLYCDSLSCDDGTGPFCNECWDLHMTEVHKCGSTPDTTTDPSDEVLLRFVAEFCGWRDLHIIHPWGLSGINPERDGIVPVPCYLESLDCWHRDVWPKIDTQSKRCNWDVELAFIVQSSLICDRVNATAHARCRALWEALGGVLPDRRET